jgi:hypothetical protein
MEALKGPGLSKALVGWVWKRGSEGVKSGSEIVGEVKAGEEREEG